MGQTFVPRLTGSVVMRLAPRLNVDDSCDALFLLCSYQYELGCGSLAYQRCLSGRLNRLPCDLSVSVQYDFNYCFAPQQNICTYLSYLYAHVVTRSKYGTGEPNHTFASVILFEALSLHSGTTAVDSARKGVKCGRYWINL